MFKREEKHVTDSEAIRSLPHNRKEVFFDLLKNRKMTLLTISVFTFLFFIPLAVDLFYFNFLETAAIAAGHEDHLFSLVFYSMLIMIPCMLVGFLGLAGSFYVIKKLVWQEGITVSTDFFAGVKDGWKHALINGAIFGVLLFALVVGGSYLIIFSPISPVISGIGIGALILVFLVFGMVLAIVETQDVYYQNSYGITFRNAFYLLGLMNWRILLVFLLSTGVVVALSCLNLITLGIGLLLFAFLNSVVVTLYTLISHSAFDKYINFDHYPDMVGKGLYKVSEDVKDDKEA